MKFYCCKIYHITLIVCAPYFVKEHFLVKTLLFFVHLRLQQKRTEKKSSPVIKFSVLPFRHYYLTIAIISNVQNVRLQRRHKPTDDASIRQWRGSQQMVQFAPHGDQTLALLLDVLEGSMAVVYTLHALFWTFLSGFGCAKIIEIC